MSGLPKSHMGFPDAQMVKNLPAMQVLSLVRKIPWRKE